MTYYLSCGVYVQSQSVLLRFALVMTKKSFFMVLVYCAKQFYAYRRTQATRRVGFSLLILLDPELGKTALKISQVKQFNKLIKSKKCYNERASMTGTTAKSERNELNR